MSLYGVISDIHGNREALAAALRLLESRGAQRIVCLGNTVGYNADPNECVALVRSRCAVALAGDLDLIALGRRGFGELPSGAEYSLRRTRQMLDNASKAWLVTLPGTHALEDGVVLAARRQDFPGARLCFFGQSHEQKVYRLDGTEVREVPGNKHSLLKKPAYFIHPGSIDASRKHGRRFAECALYDSERRTIELLRAPYDSAATEAKAAVFGYRISPLTDRLYALRRRTASAARRLGVRLQWAADSGR